MKAYAICHRRDAARHCEALPRASLRGLAAFALAAALALALSPAESGAAGASFAYQGVLLAADGGQLSPKTQTVEFRIYGAETGGSALWGRAFVVLLDDAGLFNAEISDDAGSPLADSPAGATLASVFAANADKTLFIGLTVTGSSGEIEPRQKLLAVPYASVAADAFSSSGDFTVAGRATAASARILGALEAQTLQTSGGMNIGGNLSVGGAISGNGVVPVGCIIIWSGSQANIPEGWALCNGQTINGQKTPDLRNRFVVGAGGEYYVGQSGGEKTHRLSVDEMPSHRHTYSFKAADLDGSWDNDNYFYDVSGHYNNNNTGYTNYTGGDQPHENRPPFFALCYIMRVR